MSLTPLFNPQSPQAQAISTLFTHFLILAAIVFLVVSGLVVYSLIRYRAAGRSSEPRQTFGSTRIEVTWTVIPLLVVLVLFILTLRTMAYVDAPQEPDQSPDLIVIGYQWWWEARYPNGAVTANEIEIPASKRLLVRIESGDVIHDFWLPELARKMDAVPGRPSYIWLEANTPGTYEGACSEFCGMQHAGMRFWIIAKPENEFSEWVKRQAETPPEPTSGIPAEGARLFRDHSCADCHATSAISANLGKGPPLAHLTSRRRLGGRLDNTPENLARWIANPQSIKPGNRMPDQHLSAGDLRSLVGYLETLQ